MTLKELKEINEIAQELTNLEGGPYGVPYYKTLLAKCKKHGRDGLPSISVRIDFLNESIQLPASILIEHLEKKVADMEERIAIMKKDLASYKIVKSE